jgi:S-adenosylmethionine decarboxylase
MKAIGRHLILEMWGCTNLDSVEATENALREMVDALEVTLLDLKVYPFSPVGVTGMAIVSESHLVIHTWPEYGYAAVDLFTCGERRHPEAAVPVLRRYFAPESIQVMEMTRGQLDMIEGSKVPSMAGPHAAPERPTPTPMGRPNLDRPLAAGRPNVERPAAAVARG